MLDILYLVKYKIQNITHIELILYMYIKGKK